MLDLTGGNVRHRGLDAWRRVDERRVPLIMEYFRRPEYHPKRGQVWGVNEWEAAWRSLRDRVKMDCAKDNPSRKMEAAFMRGVCRFGGGDRELSIKVDGFYSVQLFDEGSDFAVRLEAWVQGLFKGYECPTVAGTDFEYLACARSEEEAEALGGMLLEGEGLQLADELLSFVEGATGFGRGLLTSFHPMKGVPKAHVGPAHGDDWGSPVMAMMVSVGSSGAVPTAVVDVGQRFCSREVAKRDGRRLYDAASYEDVKQARWEEALRSGEAGESHPRARLWAPDGVAPQYLGTYRSMGKPVCASRQDEPYPPRKTASREGRYVLPQGTALCFDATAPHLSPGVCRDEGVRYTIYLGFSSLRNGGAARSGPVSWRRSVAGDASEGGTTAFACDGSYLMRSGASVARMKRARGGPSGSAELLEQLD